MIITILTDNMDSWFVPYGRVLKDKLSIKHKVRYVFGKEKIPKGDICFILSCARIIEEEYLSRNSHNIVVHASDLPKGKGFSPLQWQILENKNQIPITLFEAVKEVDAGPYYLKSKIRFEGNELLAEMQNILAEKIIDMCIQFTNNINTLVPINQTGKSTFYKKRSKTDSRLNIDLSIKNQFNILRVVDNIRYPSYFIYRGNKYVIRVTAEESNESN